MDISEEEILLRQPRRKKFGLYCLCISQFLERIGYYGLLMNIVMFLGIQPYLWSSYNIVIIVLLSHCWSYLISVPSAYLADACFGKFPVIVFGYFLYLFAFPLPMMYFDTWNGNNQTLPSFICIKRREADPIHAMNIKTSTLMDYLSDFSGSKNSRSYFHENCWIVVSGSLLLTLSGAAIIKSVITPLGADQFDDDDDNDSWENHFFYIYYWVVNAGILISYFAISYFQVNVDLFWGYLISYASVILSFIILSIGRCCGLRSRYVQNNESRIFGILKYCCYCCKNHDLQLQQRTRPLCLNKAKIRHGGEFDDEQVNDVKKVLHIMLVYVSYVFYWSNYYQTESYFEAQGLHMRLQIRKQPFTLPVTWLTFYNALTITILIPVYRVWIHPRTENRNWFLGIYNKMFFGMILAACTMFIAGIVEQRRMTTFWGEDNPSATHPRGSVEQEIGKTIFYASNMSVWCLIPQYFLSGVAEVFVVVPGLEFAYTQAPDNMKSLVTGFFWIASGLGAALAWCVLQVGRGTVLFSSDQFDINYREPCVVNGTVTDNYCRETRLDLYYYSLGGLQLFGASFFLITVKWILPYCGTAIGKTEEVEPHDANLLHDSQFDDRRGQQHLHWIPQYNDGYFDDGIESSGEYEIL